MQNYLEINETQLFKSFTAIIEEQNVDPYSVLTKELQQSHELCLNGLDKKVGTDLSNLCLYISGSAMHDGFELGFKTAIQLIETLTKMQDCT